MDSGGYLAVRPRHTPQLDVSSLEVIELAAEETSSPPLLNILDGLDALVNGLAEAHAAMQEGGVTGSSDPSSQQPQQAQAQALVQAQQEASPSPPPSASPAAAPPSRSGSNRRRGRTRFQNTAGHTTRQTGGHHARREGHVVREIGEYPTTEEFLAEFQLQMASEHFGVIERRLLRKLVKLCEGDVKRIYSWWNYMVTLKSPFQGYIRPKTKVRS